MPATRARIIDSAQRRMPSMSIVPSSKNGVFMLGTILRRNFGAAVPCMPNERHEPPYTGFDQASRQWLRRYRR